ncbi:integrase-like protein [Saccharothrix carnea]|uniref:Integrase-like protein n=1 Tax=Saccharothrix carnea TaxID=1280637 RepID=A0A2P8HZ28_SACCR|nr:integrase-like protein [Saccharothrix carnea]
MATHTGDLDAHHGHAPDRAARAAADADLAARIRVIHRESAGTYGVPRITAELHDTGHEVNHKRVARVMRGIGLAGLRLRRRHRTTTAGPTAVKAPDLLGRDFTAQEPNTRYVGDITYPPIADGTFLYLATVMDLCSRRLVGWAVADHMRVDLVLDALHAAQRTRGSLAGAIFHSDHGAQGEFNWSPPHSGRARPRRGACAVDPAVGRGTNRR